MNVPMDDESIKRLIEETYRQAGIAIQEVTVRAFPEETVYVVHVGRSEFRQAAEIGNSLDLELQRQAVRGFVTVRARDSSQTLSLPFSKKSGVRDHRAADLLGLLTARARTSESQPSLQYVHDAAENLTRVLAARHSLVFGRRGAGKTALMLEAKRTLQDQGHLVAWINVQTYRSEPIERAVLWTLARVGDALLSAVRSDSRHHILISEIARFRSEVEGFLGEQSLSEQQVIRLLPRAQLIVKRFCDSTASRLYIFLDDFHYLPREDQPRVLDHLHACVRDADAWLKVSAVRHFAKWYQNDPPLGLQAGHDAVAVDLDLTLQEPGKAKRFLEKVLQGFAENTGIPRISALYAPEALDRLLLASGAVPRDYLVLAAGALTHARERLTARIAGRQDVTRAAGDIAKTKIAELEDDAASESGTNSKLLKCLEVARDFCLADRKHTVFLVDFKEKEQFPKEYGLLQGLLDLRLIHLANSSVSDTHQSGVRSEAYMLDLSQYSGERLKKRLHALDFEDGHLVLKTTGTTLAPRVGNTPRKLITILRSAPQFELKNFSEIARA